MHSYNTAKNVISASEYDAVRGKKSEEKTQKVKKDLGTIFMGPETSREMNIDEILGQSTRALWNKNTEEEYMTRLKEKAVLKVKSLLAKAEEKAQDRLNEAEKEVEEVYARAKEKEVEAQKILEQAEQIKLEAENIKIEAREQGYTQGLHQAQQQLNEAREEIVQEKSQYTKACSSVLLNIHEQCITIFESWRNDLTQLLLEAVEKSTGYIIDNEKSAILQSLLQNSVNALLDKREYKVRVNPSEAIILTGLMEEVNKSFALNSHWTLESDDSLEAGSIVVESPSGLIRNEKSDRESLVQEVLNKLTLPLGEGDQLAYDAITRNLVGQAREAKIPLSPEEEEAYAQENRENIFSQPSLIENDMQNVSEMEQETPKSEQLLSQASEEVFDEQTVEPEIAQETKVQEEASIEPTETVEPIVNLEQETANNEELLAEQASQMVEDELSQINDEVAAETVVDNKNEKQADLNTEKTGYTTELADELLNEMGFN